MDTISKKVIIKITAALFLSHAYNTDIYLFPIGSFTIKCTQV